MSKNAKNVKVALRLLIRQMKTTEHGPSGWYVEHLRCCVIGCASFTRLPTAFFTLRLPVFSRSRLDAQVALTACPTDNRVVPFLSPYCLI